MGIEAALFTRLSAVSGVTDIVKQNIFPLRAPQGVARPYVVYSRISSQRVKNLAVGPSYIARVRMQIDCYHTTYASCHALAEQIRLALDGYRGTIGDVVIKATSLISDRDLDEVNTDPKLYRVSMDFLITHNESTS